MILYLIGIFSSCGSYRIHKRLIKSICQLISFVLGAVLYLAIVLNKLLENDIVPVLWDVNDHFYSRTMYRIKADDDRQMIADITAKLHD